MASDVCALGCHHKLAFSFVFSRNERIMTGSDTSSGKSHLSSWGKSLHMLPDCFLTRLKYITSLSITSSILCQHI